MGTASALVVVVDLGCWSFQVANVGQLLVEHLQQTLVQAGGEHPLAKAADGRLIGYRFARLQAGELLEAHPVAQLRLSLRITQPVEVFGAASPQKHRRAMPRPSSL